MPAPTPVAGQTALPLAVEDGSTLSSAEYRPDVTAGAANGFVAIWQDFLPAAVDADGGEMTMFRRFAADGTALGTIERVSTDLTGNTSAADIVTLADGRVAIGWEATLGGGAGGNRIGALLLDPATGTVIARHEAVATGASVANGPLLRDMVALPGGKAGMLFSEGSQLRLAVIEADGSLTAPITLFTSFTSGGFFDQSTTSLTTVGQSDQAVALAGANAGVIAFFTQTVQGFSEIGKQLRFVNADASVAALATIALPDATNDIFPTIASLADGGFAVAYVTTPVTAAATVRVGLFSAAGALVNAAYTDIPTGRLPGGALTLEALPDGGVMLGITSVPSLGSADFDVHLQRITAAAALDGGLVLAHAATTGAQQLPGLAVTSGGQLVAAWQDAPNQFTIDVRAARFDLAEAGILRSGTGAAETLGGGAGADTLLGRGGDDSLAGGDGNDVLNGMLGADSLAGGAGDDTLGAGAGAGANTLDGGDGADRLASGTDGDLLLGGEGADTLFGDDGADTLDGGAAADRLRGDGGDDRAAGGEGADSVSGGAGADTLAGDAGADTLRGEADGDLLLGGDGNDQIFGDDGLDTLVGGAGADTLRGGAGNDIIRYADLAESGPLAADLLFDFARGDDDLDLSAIDADATTLADDAFAFIGAAAFSGGLGVAQIRQVRDIGLRQIRLELDSADADAEADMVITVRGLTLLDSGDIVL